MRNLISAELRKLTTTRWIYLLALGVVAMAVVSVVDPARDPATFDQEFHEHVFVLFTALLTRILILVVGIRVITDELRHGTIVSTLLVTPQRRRVLLAKGAAVAGVGAALAGLGWASMTGAASVIAASEGATLSLGAGAWQSLAGTVAAGAAWGLIGLGLGTIVRSQVAVTVGALVWLMALEEGVRGWLGDLGAYLPGQAGLALAIAPTPRVMAIAGATLGAYVAAATLAGAVALRRDVT